MPRPPVVIQNHFYGPSYGGGYGGGMYYHPWYHPVFVWPSYGNYSTGHIGGFEATLVGLVVFAVVGMIAYGIFRMCDR